MSRRKPPLPSVVAVALTLLLAPLAAAQSGAKPSATGKSALSPVEKAAGWQVLFDGSSTDAWRGYRQEGFPAKGWLIEDGLLKCTGQGGGDIITREQYGDFELELEFRLQSKGNSGIMYRVSEKHGASWQTGPEYQLLDDAGHNFEPTHIHSTAALYDLYPPSADKQLRPPGEFNTARIWLKDGLLKHFLNGRKVLECRIDSPEWKEKIAGSKFARYEGFGVLPRGHIALQDHGAALWFRNIRVRSLDAPLPRQVTLFDGHGLDAWAAHLPEGTKLEDVWTVRDGVLVCKGNPPGYIYTRDDFASYVLKLEWRWNPETKQTGNSGVLLRVVGPHKVWPRCVEAQLQADNAGDFWNIDEFPMQVVAERTSGRNTKKTHHAERPVGEWNEYEIIVAGPRITLNVNGETLNEAWDVQETPGRIALQSEGTEIHFRDIRLSPLK